MIRGAERSCLSGARGTSWIRPPRPLTIPFPSCGTPKAVRAIRLLLLFDRCANCLLPVSATGGGRSHCPLTNKGLPPLVSPRMHLLLVGHHHEYSPVTASHPHTQFSVVAPRAKGANADLLPPKSLSLPALFALSHSAGRTA